MSVATLLSLMAVHLAGAASPGPSFVMILRVAAARGLTAALGVALGFAIGAMLWAGAALLGLSLLFEVAPVLLSGLRYVGAAFLLFVAFLMWRHADAPVPEASGEARRGLGPVTLGLLTQMSNPKTAVFFGAVFLGLVPPEAGLGARGVVLAAVFVVEGLWYALVAVALSRPPIRRGYARAKATLDRAFGGLIALFGVKIALG